MTKFRHLIWMLIAASGLILSAPQSEAQTRQPDVGDQPGLLADDSVQLDPQFRKTAVLYRTSEVPGTIIVVTPSAISTWSRVTAAHCAMASAWAARDSSGRASSTSRARRNGRTGRHRRR